MSPNISFATLFVMVFMASFVAAKPAPIEGRNSSYLLVPSGCSQSIPCGGVMSSIDGVDAYSNGGDQCSGNSCAGTGTYGDDYQCVELAQRYFAKKFGVQDNWWVPYAKDMCSSYPKGVKTTSSPAHGDLIVFDWAPYGHVAVIDTVSSSSVDVVEQNNMPSGRNTYPRSEAYCYLTH